jgi:hypothetical protein
VLKLARMLVVALSSLAILIVLPSVASAETCPNAEYRVGPSANLPDCRAYEQVTPVEKDGGVFLPHGIGLGPEGAPDLVTASFAAIDGIKDDNGVEGALYSTERTASGWVTSPLPPSAAEYQTAIVAGGVETYLAGSLDGRSALWQGRRIGQPEDRVDLWVTRPDGVVEDVGPLTPPGTPSGEVHTIIEELGVDPRGVSGDLSHIVYRTKPEGGGYRFWPFDTTQETGDSEDLYEFVGTDNTAPMLVGVDDAGDLISDCGTVLGGGKLVEGHHRLTEHNAMSSDGEVVFFTAEACGSSPPVNELFARVDNGQPDAHTVAISEPSPEDCSACNTSAGRVGPAIFEGASLDGSKVFFLTEQPLLGGDRSMNLYEYDFDAPAGGRIVRVSGGGGTISDPVAEVEGVVQSSEDGSHVYFVAHGVLTTTSNSQGQVAHRGANNLYVFERDAQYPAGRTAFIADLSSADTNLWSESNAGERQSNVTPDGRFLVFTSATEHLTSDDTSTAVQVFEYDAQTGGLVRVSIGQGGYDDNGNTDVAPASIVAPGYSEASSPNGYWSHLSVSADGSYVFFQSTDGLTPQALNKKVIAEKYNKGGTALESVYANNIYEYHDGSVYLISDGHDLSELVGGSDVLLWGTDESGADVLFTTSDVLAPTDIDTDLDVYDARIDGGFPAPVVVPACSGDECQGALSPAPVLLAPGSEFQAGGNPPLAAPAPAVAAKPKARKAVKKKPKKKKKSAGRRGKGASGAAVKRAYAHGKGGRG